MGTGNGIVLEFGGGEYPFALDGKQVEELEMELAVRNAKGEMIPIGFGAIFQRIFTGVWGHRDIYHTIRLGLEGGGMGAVEARRIANSYAVPPYKPGVIGGPEATAIAVAQAAMHGVAELIDDKGEADPPGEQIAGE